MFLVILTSKLSNEASKYPTSHLMIWRLESFISIPPPPQIYVCVYVPACMCEWIYVCIYVWFSSRESYKSIPRKHCVHNRVGFNSGLKDEAYESDLLTPTIESHKRFQYFAHHKMPNLKFFGPNQIEFGSHS